MPPSEQSVEQVNKRGQNVKHYRNPDGTYSAVISNGSIHYKAVQGGPWLDKKQRFAAGPGTNEWISSESDITMRTYQVGQGGNARWWIQFTETLTGMGIEFEVLGQPSTSEGSPVLSFQDGAARTWTYTHSRAGGKMWGPPMASAEPVTTYTFNYRLIGGAPALTVTPEGDLVCGTIFTMPRSYMRGANNIDYPAGPWSIGQGNPGTVSFTMNHLSAGLPVEAYPFRLDPSTTFAITANGNDATVQASAATYPPAGPGTYTTGETAVYAVRDLVTGTYRLWNTLYKWDTSSLGTASATVTGATFRGILESSANTDGLLLTADWGPLSFSASDWSQPPLTNAHAGASFSTVPSGDPQVDLTLINAAANVSTTGDTYLRFHLSQRAANAAPTSGGNYHGFYSFEHATQPEPKLIVDYTLPIVSVKPLTALSHLVGLPGVSAEGAEGYDSTRKIVRFHDAVQAKAIPEQGFIPYAYPIGMSSTLVTTTALQMVTTGGAVAFPVVLEGHMLLGGAEWWNTDTTNARGPVVAALYEDRLNNSNTLDLVAGTEMTTATFTPGSAAARTLVLDSGTAVYLPPGCYWVFMKNNNTTRGVNMGSGAAGTMAANVAQTKTLATGAVTSTLDLVAATWTKVTTPPHIVLHGRVFGQAANF